MIDDKIREMVIKGESVDLIKNYAVTSCGMATLRDDALLKVKEGVTTFEEALRITTED
jgi:type II secretory ATPase GspE/PulE/Tfp pilus assembly ATPase PilB-like protein